MSVFSVLKAKKGSYGHSEAFFELSARFRIRTRILDAIGDQRTLLEFIKRVKFWAKTTFGLFWPAEKRKCAKTGPYGANTTLKRIAAARNARSFGF